MSGATRFGEVLFSSPAAERAASAVVGAAERLGSEVPFIRRAIGASTEAAREESGVMATGLRRLVSDADSFLLSGGRSPHVHLDKSPAGEYTASFVGGKYLGAKARWTADSSDINVTLANGNTHSIDKVPVGNVQLEAIDAKLAFVGPQKSPFGFGERSSQSGNGLEPKSVAMIGHGANGEAAMKPAAEVATRPVAAAADVDDYKPTPALTAALRHVSNDVKNIVANGGQHGFIQVAADSGNSFSLRFTDGAFAGTTGKWMPGAEYMQLRLPNEHELNVPLKGASGVIVRDPHRSFIDGPRT